MLYQIFLEKFGKSEFSRSRTRHLKMGADAPIPPFAMSAAAAPDGAPPQRICHRITILAFNLLLPSFISWNQVILDTEDNQQNLYFLNFLF